MGLVLLLLGLLTAADVQLTSFADGSVASAAAVNQNFADLRDAIATAGAPANRTATTNPTVNDDSGNSSEGSTARAILASLGTELK